MAQDITKLRYVAIAIISAYATSGSNSLTFQPFLIVDRCSVTRFDPDDTPTSRNTNFNYWNP